MRPKRSVTQLPMTASDKRPREEGDGEGVDGVSDTGPISAAVSSMAARTVNTAAAAQTDWGAASGGVAEPRLSSERTRSE